MTVVFLFTVTVLEGNYLYRIISMLNHTISSFSFSRSKLFLLISHYFICVFVLL